MISIIDYKAGNLTSVKRALNYLNIPNTITADHTEILKSKGIIFPGVGAAGSAMQNLQSLKIDAILKEAVSKNIPLLGICLGCQIILEYSEENKTSTLGLIPGKCIKFDPNLKEEDGSLINIPHMGWNKVHLKKDCLLFKDVEKEAEFYFVHSYYTQPKEEFVLGTTFYGTEFCSVLGREGLWALQFHPEKSGRPGLKILENFWNYVRSL